MLNKKTARSANVLPPPPPPPPQGAPPTNPNKQTNLAASPSSSQPPTNKPKAKAKPDSPVKASVKGLQNAILKYKEALESLDIGSKANPGKQFSDQDRLGRSPGKTEPLVDFTNKFLPKDWQLKKNLGKGTDNNNYAPLGHKEYIVDTFNRNIPFTDLGNRNLSPQEIENLGNKEMLGGTNPLGNFLIKNYLNTEAMSYSHRDVPDKYRKDQSVKPYDFRELVKTIGQIGTPNIRSDSKEESRLKSQIEVLDSKNSTKYNAEINKAREKAKIEYDKAISSNYSQDRANNVYNSEFEAEKKKIDAKYSLYLSQRKFLQSKLNNTAAKLDSEYEKKNPGAGEEKIDGIFEQRTLNSLQAISGITTALINFSKDMGKEVSDLSSELTKYNQVLNVFKRVIDRRDPVQQDAELKGKIVNALTETVYKQADFISDEFKQIIEAPEVKSFVTQEHSFMAFNKYNSDPQKEAKESESMFKERLEGNTLKPDLTPYVNAYKQTFQDGTAGIKVNFKNKELVFSYDSLWTTYNLANTYKSAFGKNPTREELSDLLDSIKQTVNSMSINRANQEHYNQYYRDPQVPQEKPRTPWQALSGGWSELTGKPKN